MLKVHIRFSFLLFNALLFLMCDIQHITAFYTVCTLHELGHAAAAVMTGAGVRRIILSGCGVIMETGTCIRMCDGAAVLVSGPAVNILLWLLLTAAGCSGPLRDMDLAAGLFNLLPFPGLDGGSLAELFISGRVCEPLLRRLLLILQILTGAGLAAALLFC